MAEITSGDVTVLVLTRDESAALGEVLEHVAKYVACAKRPRPKAPAVYVRKASMAANDLFELFDAYGIPFQGVK